MSTTLRPRAARTTARTAAALLAVGLLAACGSADEAGFAPTPEEGPEDSSGQDDDAAAMADTPPDSGSDDTGSAGSGTNDAAADDAGPTERVDQAALDPEDALQTLTYEITMPGSSGDTLDVTAAVHTVRVSGDVMLVELSFTPEFHAASTRRYGIFEMYGSNALRPVLNDRLNLRQYHLLEDELGDQWRSETSLFSIDAVSGQTLGWWGYYAAPIDDVDTISIALPAVGVEFTDVEIER